MNRPFSPKRGNLLLSRDWIGFLSISVITSVVAIVYFPSLGIGYWMDDYIAIDFAGRLSGLDYLVKYFDPHVQRLWYRPMIGIQWKIEYLLFHGDPFASHLVQVALHLFNCLLLSLLIGRVTRKWQAGLVAAMIFATLPLTSMAIYWPSVHDPLAMVFYLSSILFWINFLESRKKSWYVMTLASTIAALLTKEISVTLPAALFLLERWLSKEPFSLLAQLKRYWIFFLVTLCYGFLVLIVARQSAFTQQIGYRFGIDNVPVFLQYLSWLAFPWELDFIPRYVWLVGAFLLLIYFGIRERGFLLLGVMAILLVALLAPIPAHLFNPRYLYPAVMTSSIGFGLGTELLLRRRLAFHWGRALGLLCVTLVIVSGSSSINERIENHAGFIRQIRLHFRTIYQAHPAFPPNTFLYFIDTPLQTLDVSGLMYSRYGSDVSVGGIDQNMIGILRNYGSSYVYYMDDEDVFREQSVEKNVQLSLAPSLPIQFGNAISLNSIEVPRANLKRGDAVILLAAWKATSFIDKNYAMFAHLLNSRGEIVAGYDTQPRRGNLPTTLWQPNQIVVDALIIPLASEIPLGNYQVEIGWYYQPSQERVPILDPTEKNSAAVLVESFSIIE